MLKEQLTREIERAFMREFKTSLKDVNYYRPSPDSELDPVTGEYTEGVGGVDENIKALFRKPRGRIVDGVTITNDDMKVTVMQKWLSVEPEENDVINDEWRVIKHTGDAADVLWNIYVRRI